MDYFKSFEKETISTLSKDSSGVDGIRKLLFLLSNLLEDPENIIQFFSMIVWGGGKWFPCPANCRNVGILNTKLGIYIIFKSVSRDIKEHTKYLWVTFTTKLSATPVDKAACPLQAYLRGAAMDAIGF